MTLERLSAIAELKNLDAVRKSVESWLTELGY